VMVEPGVVLLALPSAASSSSLVPLPMSSSLDRFVPFPFLSSLTYSPCSFPQSNRATQELVRFPSSPLSSPLTRPADESATTRSQPISEQQVKELCLKAREILVEEANIQWVDSPVTVRTLSFLLTMRTG
jgi:hypothetical protein